MQEVALAAVRQANPPSDPEKIAPWLYRIALRKVINHHRAQGRGKQLVRGVIEKGEVRSNDREPAPGAWLLGQEDQASLASGLAKLSAQDRQILLLKYTEGWGYEALARHLGITVKTVEYRLLKARRALRAQLSAIE
jgi:RNA polymerase sigma-70 factor (ECF subfamily)